MRSCLFFGDSITDANHLFDPENIGNGYLAVLAKKKELQNCILQNRGHDGFTVENLWRLLKRDGIEPDWDIITILIGVNDIPVDAYTSHPRIPEEFTDYYEKVLDFLTARTRAHLILIEPFLFDEPQEYQNWRHYIETESQIIQELARNYQAFFLPTDHLLRQAARDLGTEQISLDGIHLTPEGNQILADLWMDAYQSLEKE